MKIATVITKTQKNTSDFWDSLGRQVEISFSTRKRLCLLEKGVRSMDNPHTLTEHGMLCYTCYG